MRAGRGAGWLTTIAVLVMMVAPVVAGERVIQADAWFQRTFDTNLKACALRIGQPSWCPVWMDAMEAARAKPTDLSLPEWRRLVFSDNMTVCTSLLTPDWCPDWYGAMRKLSTESAYKTLADGLAAQRIREEDERAAKIKAWRDAVARAGAGRPSPDDLTVIRQHIQDGDAAAMELMGWMYVNAVFFKRDYTRAYEMYGRAVLAGREDLRPTLDALWKQLNETQKLEINQIFK